MPISVKCPDCGKALKAPDAMAGKKAKCPQCGTVVPIPAPVVDAEEIQDTPPPTARTKPTKSSSTIKKKPASKPVEDDYDSTFDDLADYETEAPAAPSSKKKPCPMCGELIAASAAKCRFCGEILDAKLRKREQKKKSRASSVGDGDLTTVDILLCVFCGGIACIVGIVALIRGESSRGWKMIGFSFAMSAVWRAVGFVIEQVMKQ